MRNRVCGFLIAPSRKRSGMEINMLQGMSGNIKFCYHSIGKQISVDGKLAYEE